MDPLLEKNPTEFWKRFRCEKSLEELAIEQGTKIPATFDGYFADIMPPEETPEMLNAKIEEWRDEDRRRTNG